MHNIWGTIEIVLAALGITVLTSAGFLALLVVGAQLEALGEKRRAARTLRRQLDNWNKVYRP